MSKPALSSNTLLYLLAIEDIARSPLIRSQVIDLLEQVAVEEGDRRIVLAALYPIANWLRFRGELAELKQLLARMGIRLYVAPLLFLTRHFHISNGWMPLFQIQAWGYSLWLWLRWRPRLVHCRSYPAALVGHHLQALFRTKVIFDARSLYPEEGAVVDEGGKDEIFDQSSFTLWKRVEAALIQSADATVVVSQPMQEMFAAQYPIHATKVHVIPILTHIPALSDLARWREEVRGDLGISSDTCVITYVGSWFEASLTLPAFKLVIDSQPDLTWHILLLVRDTPEAVIGQLRSALGDDMGVTVRSVPHAHVYQFLAAADLAVLPQAKRSLVQDPNYITRSRSVLSIKFTEYLACGLPVLVSRDWAGAAADIVEAEDLGVIYDEASPPEIASWLDVWKRDPDTTGRRAWNYAKSHFATSVVAGHYAMLYRRLSP